MAARTKKAKKAASKASAAAATTSPWVQRLVEDEDLRDNFRVAFEAAKDAYDRISSDGKSPQALVSDKKLQKDLNKAAGALKDAGSALKEGPKPKKKRRPMRKLLLLFVGAGIALAVSEDLRTKVLDLLFGKEEEFEYTSTTPPAS
jgi:SspJ family small acid-soluble spore protein